MRLHHFLRAALSGLPLIGLLAASPTLEAQTSRTTTRTTRTTTRASRPAAKAVVKRTTVKRTVVTRAATRPTPRRVVKRSVKRTVVQRPGATYRLARVAEPGIPIDLSRPTWVYPPPASFNIGPNPRVRLVTNRGAIVIALNAKAAPLHARSFAFLARRGFFNNTIFHRRDDLTGQGGFIVQGGDPFTRSASTRDLAGRGGPGYTIPRERSSLRHDRLVIAAARTSDPNSAGSQFYITQGPTYFLDQGDGYTVFGRIVSGQSAALNLRQGDKIIRAQVL
jgi:cyclophilin family peptidyl-prolyl cis-trans isomerase